MFLNDLIHMGSFTLNHTWHNIDFLMVLECCLLMVVASLLLATMSKRLRVFAVASSIFWATAAFAANSTLTALTASGAVAGTDTYYTVQTPGAGGVKSTAAKIATYINSLFSGDATVTSGGAVTLATVNANVGTFGSATQCTTFTTNGKGLITAASQATCTPAIASLTGAGTGVLTALGINVGTAGSFVVNGGALGTPASGTATNLTGTASGLTAGNVTTNANLTGAVTSTGNATLLGSFSSANLLAALTTKTGTGNNVFGTAPTIDSLNATTALTLAFLTGSTQCLQVNTSGVVSGTGSVCGSGGSTGANPTATAGPTAINGVASTFLRSDGAPAIQLGTAAQKGIVQADGTTITAASGVISAVNTGTVTNVATSCGLAGGAITSTGTISSNSNPNVQAGANYAIQSTDCGSIVYLNNASNQIPTIAAAGGAGFLKGFSVELCNIGAGTQTITPTTSTIGGAATYVLAAGSAAAPKCIGVNSDGTNYVLDLTGPGSSGASPGGSSGQIQTNNGSGGFNGGNLSGDCTTSASLVTSCSGAHPGYVVNNWYVPGGTGRMVAGQSLVANSIACQWGFVPKLVTISTIGASIQAAGTASIQLAIYTNNTSGRPGTLVKNTAAIVDTSQAFVSGATVGGNIQIGPGSTPGANLWFCINTGDASPAVMITNETNSPTAAFYAGDATGANILTPANGASTTFIYCTGANCNGGSSTYNSGTPFWPTLTGSTWTSGPNFTQSGAVVAFKVFSFP